MPPKCVPQIVAQELVVVAGDVDDARALARLAQQLLHDVVVRLRPVPALLQPPAVDDVADEIDRLGADLGFLASNRAKAKVRAWFNEQIRHETVARGREAVEKLLQREGKTAVKLEDLASQLGFKSAEDLFAVVGKDEYSLRHIEALLKPVAPPATPDEFLLLKKPRHGDRTPKGGVLVVGIDSLMTQLAKCCKPAPPDAIAGFVTRGKGVSVHRRDCSNFREMAARTAERVIEVEWGASGPMESGLPGRHGGRGGRPAGPVA